MALELKYLNRKWTHSFEEDTENEMVYRPEGFALGKARGRTQLEFKENGKVIDTQVGRDDVPDAVIGTWKLEGDHLIIDLSDGSRQAYPVKEVTPEKLVLKK
ncbi:hypothetical protein [Pedobacter immunditicola]|uniref:hypothetical protein n=1 Tax=Pedobacter immunditicola TaxID=3133440 RepID=UPI0030A92EA9